MALVFGDVILNAEATHDCLHGPFLLTRDGKGIGARRKPPHQHILGYDSAFKDPQDPFRWAIIKQAIDSNTPLDIFGVKADAKFQAVDAITGGGKVKDFTLNLLGAGGITLPRQGTNKAPGLYSSNPDRDQIFYVSPKASGAKSSSLPHELFGHWFLNFKSAPYTHKASDVITTAHKILDPIGVVYTGPAAEVKGSGVPGFVELYAGDEGKSNPLPISPTLHVEPPKKGSWFDEKIADFKKLVGPEMAKSGNKFDNAAFNDVWISLSNNHEIAMRAFVRTGRTKLLIDVVTPVIEAYKALDPDPQKRFEKFVFAVRTGGTNFVGLGAGTRLADDTQKQIDAIKAGTP